jgi:hypothetical protein
MTALYWIAWVAIASIAVWAVMKTRNSADMNRLEAEMRDEVTYWQGETSRVRAYAAQIARDTAIRADAWKEGRDDVIAIMPFIVSALNTDYTIQSAYEETRNN